MNNRELANLVAKLPKKVRGCFRGMERYVNIEKQDFKAILMEYPEGEYFEVDVRANGIYVDAIGYQGEQNGTQQKAN